MYAISLETCLRLEVDDPRIHARFPTDTTLDTVYNPLPYLYGAFTLYGASFQKTSSSATRIKRQAKHHISFVFLQRIQFALDRFLSLILTASQLISLPSGTKMFQFPEFPMVTHLM